jgi:predicted AAA+ superfamily ATPase
MAIIARSDLIHNLENGMRIHPVVALLGPRQCGKTTLAKQYARDKHITAAHHFDLEDPDDLAKLDAPKLALEPLKGLIVIDEVQRKPELFPLLRVLVDQHEERHFLILGSASRDLIKQSSETLAGRICNLEITPFSCSEVDKINKLWLRGGFPKSYLAKNIQDSYDWRAAYVTTFLERDIPNLGIQIPPRTLRRFWMMLAHYHGAIFNASEIGTSLGISHTTARHYLDILTGTFMIRELSPWIENINKRQIKSPKIYFRDSGIFHNLLGISTLQALQHHPKLGASWEGFALEAVIQGHHAKPEECYFWGIHTQGELDLLILKDGKRLGFEFKYSDAPRLTSSMKLAKDALRLDKLTVIYPGKSHYHLSETIEVRGLEGYLLFLKNPIS